MKHESYRKEWRVTKASTKQRIVDAIGEGGITFGELEEKVDRSRPVLSDYLKQLAKDGIIEQQTKGIGRERRIEYVLTDKGKGQEQIVRDLVARGFQAIKDLSSENPAAKGLVELSKLAKDEPTVFKELLQWMNDYMALLASPEALQWVTKHGEQGQRALGKEMTKQLSDVTEKRPKSEGKIQPKEMMPLLHALLNATRETISKER